MNIKVGQILERKDKMGPQKVLGVLNENLYAVSLINEFDSVGVFLTALDMKDEYVLPKEKWVPKVGEEYWYISNVGVVWGDTWRNYGTDNERLAFGNVFQTKELAQEASEKIKKLFRQYLR